MAPDEAVNLRRVIGHIRFFSLGIALPLDIELIVTYTIRLKKEKMFNPE